MVVYTLLKKHTFAVLKCQKNCPSDQSEVTQDQLWLQGAHIWSQVRVSVMAVTDTVRFRDLVASPAEPALLVPLLPLVCMSCQWKLYTSMSSWSTTVMSPTPMVANNRRRVGPMPPAPTTRTNNDRSLCWPSNPNPSNSRSWREYHKIWLVRSLSLICHPHTLPPLSKLKSNMDQLVLLPPQLLRPC